jgi:hypothetical protein
VAKKSRTGSRASRTRTTKPAPEPVTDPYDRFFTSKVTVARASTDVPMLVLSGDWLKAVGFRIGATAFLCTDKYGDITLTRLGLKRPRRLKIVKAKA